LQSIARLANNLSISELELMTMAYVVCAFITYILWWHKPFDVEQSYTIILSEPAVPSPPRDFVHICDCSTVNDIFNSQVPDSTTRVPDLTTMTADAIFYVPERSTNLTVWSPVALYLSATAFSAIHIGAWNWEFPTPVARALWRAFSVIATTSSILPLLRGFISGYLQLRGRGVLWVKRMAVFSVFSLFCYVVARLALLVLTFYCFSSMPQRVYTELDWTAWLPHFS
jgi:hypothetical protein